MREQLEKRIQELQVEYETAQKMLAEMVTQQTQHKETMLRISGAIQVLREELTKSAQPKPDNGKESTGSKKQK